MSDYLLLAHGEESRASEPCYDYELQGKRKSWPKHLQETAHGKVMKSMCKS